MAATPRLIASEIIAGRRFDTCRIFFVTARGGCAVRIVHRIDRKGVAAAEFEARRAEALRAGRFAKPGAV